MSIHSITRSIMEWTQQGKTEDLFAVFYKWMLYASAQKIYDDIENIFYQRVELPKFVVIIATHFEMAHQISKIKERLEKDKGVKIKLVVQVTDDSPQHMWYVPGAEVIFVPSYKTKYHLEDYARRKKYFPVKIEVLPYPVSPILGAGLTEYRYRSRISQLSKAPRKDINVAIPISGAAVGTDFFKIVMCNLYNESHNFVFHVVSKCVPFTRGFLNEMKKYDYVKLYVSDHARETVDLYEELYMKENVSLEITKPSEQAFKALLCTDQAGGSVLLFSKPVGRQEHDNIDFLRRHDLIFSEKERDFLWQKAAANQSMGDFAVVKFFEDKTKLRGVEIPSDPDFASRFIWWALTNGIFEKIAEHGYLHSNLKNIETRSDGVELFWERIKGLVIEMRAES